MKGVVDTSLFTNRIDLMTPSAGHLSYWPGTSYSGVCATSSGWSTQM